MRASHRQQVIQKLDHLVAELEELKERKLVIKTGWKDIDDDVEKIYDFFLKTIEHYIDGCKYLRDVMPKIPRAYWSIDLWEELIDFQYYKAHHFRTFSLRFFPPPTVERLYNYLFINDVLRTFPKDLNLMFNIKFLVTHSNIIALFPIQEALLGLAHSINTVIATASQITRDTRPSPYSEEVLDSIEDIDAYAFECDPRERLQNKMILGHEIFHMILNKNPIIEEKISLEFSSGTFDEYISNLEESGVILEEISPTSHLIELFCDFGAAWHLGPCFGFAALNELAYGGKEASSSHPPRSARIKLILNIFKYQRHSSISRLKENAAVYNNEMRSINDSTISSIFNVFKKIIIDELKIKRYKPSSIQEKVKKHIFHRIPFIYGKDIRELFNNVPPTREISNIKTDDLNKFLFESIRKNLMWLTFEKAMIKKTSIKPKLKLPKTLED